MKIEHGGDRPIERICEAMSHPTRRALLRLLRTVETTTARAAADDLVEARERESDEVARPETPERVEIMLYHVHLPKMADAGVIDYAPEAGTIRTNDTTDVIHEVLSGLSSGADR